MDDLPGPSCVPSVRRQKPLYGRFRLAFENRPARINIPKVEIVNINAMDPWNTKVNYRIEPAGTTITSATFTTPGKVHETKIGLFGSFFFTFNQNNLEIGDNAIKLNVKCDGES